MVNPIEIDGRLDMLIQQRNTALDHAVLLAGQIARLEAELTALKAAPPKFNPPPTDGNVPLHIVNNDAA